MRLAGVTVRRFRNLADQQLRVPARGVVLLGANGQGKTSFLEAVAYPVLCRSFRTSLDSELVRFGEVGFHVGLDLDGAVSRELAVTLRVAGRRREILRDGEPVRRVVDVAGTWLAVVFAPEDVRLASGPAQARRLYLDRTLALADGTYLRALTSYRNALAQRNGALRQGRPDLARAFDAPLASAGAVVVSRRVRWVSEAAEPFRRSLLALGEASAEADLQYQGDAGLVDPSAWPERLEQATARDLARRMTTVGPHRDDLGLRLGGKSVRDYGSTGQHRSAAIALKLLELETIERARGQAPALLLDDVFAELDADRQARLAAQLFRREALQVLVTAPRADELPGGLELPVWRVAAGRIETD